MIEIRMSTDDYVYDVQGLCKSFYPSEQIVMESWNERSKEGEHVIAIFQGTDYVELTWQKGEDSGQLHRNVPENTRRSYKNTIKKILYEYLSKQTGNTLPWGTLTGVRPTKLVMERLVLGENREQIARFMKEQYYCSEEKIALGYEISKRELELLRAIDYENGYSLYIGIPFCPTRCSYCSFPSYPVGDYEQLVEKYLEALFQEIAYVSTRQWNQKLSTIYIGGGTPTTLSAEQLQRLLRHIKQHFPMEDVVEFTVEAGRPDSITREKLQVMKAEGVTRISINPQSMNQETLDLIGRKHTVSQVKEIFQMAREEGHDTINMDLIIGLPGETAEHMEQTLQQLDALQPDNLTVHSLVLKRAARLNTDYVNHLEMSKQKEETAQASPYELEGQSEKMAQMAAKYAKTHGYEPYYMYRQKNATGSDCDSRENIGYAKPGKECLYNILIMEEKQTILALGAGASSKFLLPAAKKPLQRVENVKSVTDYISRIQEMIGRKEAFWQAHREELQGSMHQVKKRGV